MTGIGYQAFQGTGYYNNDVNWEDGVLYIGNYLIRSKSTVSEYAIKSGTLLIANGAFNSCNKLNSVTIPNGVTSIGYRAFAECNWLESITIPSSVTYIERQAFANCRLRSVIFENPNGWWLPEQSSPTSFFGVDLANPATAAKYLSSYWSEAWKRD